MAMTMTMPNMTMSMTMFMTMSMTTSNYVIVIIIDKAYTTIVYDVWLTHIGRVETRPRRWQLKSLVHAVDQSTELPHPPDQ